MKKRELIFFLSAVLLILALFFGERLDRMILPEYRLPHYEKLLSQRALSQYFLSDPWASSENLFIVDMQSRSFGDLHMQIEGDGTILLLEKTGSRISRFRFLFGQIFRTGSTASQTEARRCPVL